MVKPSQRREMARNCVKNKKVSIRVACKAFAISETCYRYEPLLSDENTVIADWLIRLTSTWRNWGFGLVGVRAVPVGVAGRASDSEAGVNRTIMSRECVRAAVKPVYGNNQVK